MNKLVSPAALGAVILLSASVAASAQSSPACQRLEAQLTALDRGNDDPGRAEAVRRAEDAANRQQTEVDRLVVQGRRIGFAASGGCSASWLWRPNCGVDWAENVSARSALGKYEQ